MVESDKFFIIIIIIVNLGSIGIVINGLECFVYINLIKFRINFVLCFYFIDKERKDKEVIRFFYKML